MNYKVTFYKDLNHLLTERKANYVNQLKKLTTRLTEELGKKMDGEGTLTEKMISKMIQMKRKGIHHTTFEVSLPDFVNTAISFFPNTGKPISVYFKFVDGGGHHTDKVRFLSQGVCHKSILSKQVLIKSIEVTINFSISDSRENDKSIHKMLLDELQTTLVHELAHAKDEIRNAEYVDAKSGNVRNTARTSDADLKYLHYWLDPSEIRSHMNEMIKRMSGSRHETPKREIKNIYKKLDNSEKGLSDFDKSAIHFISPNDKLSKSEKSIKFLKQVLNNAFRNTCPKLISQFVLDYHISFVRDTDARMKNRYYDPYFSDVDVPSFSQMDDFYDEIKSAYRQLTKLKNEVEKSSRRMSLYHRNSSTANDNFYQFKENFWDNPQFTKAFQSYNAKLLKKDVKSVIEDFRAEHGFETKTMLNKNAKKMANDFLKQFK